MKLKRYNKMKFFFLKKKISVKSILFSKGQLNSDITIFTLSNIMGKLSVYWTNISISISICKKIERGWYYFELRIPEIEWHNFYIINK